MRSIQTPSTSITLHRGVAIIRAFGLELSVAWRLRGRLRRDFDLPAEVVRGRVDVPVAGGQALDVRAEVDRIIAEVG